MNSILDAHADFILAVNENQMQVDYGIFASCVPDMPVTHRRPVGVMVHSRPHEIFQDWSARNAAERNRLYGLMFENLYHQAERAIHSSVELSTWDSPVRVLKSLYRDNETPFYIFIPRTKHDANRN